MTTPTLDGEPRIAERRRAAARPAPWSVRIGVLTVLVALTFLLGLQPWLPRIPSDPAAPLPPPRVLAVTPGADELYAGGACGPTVTDVLARLSVPNEVTAVRLTTTKDGRGYTVSMVPSEGGYRSSIGPYAGPGTVSYVVTVTDRDERRVRSAPGRLAVRACDPS